MNKYKNYENPIHEPDECKREGMTFNKPFQTSVLEGVAKDSQDNDLGSVAILSSN